MQILADATTLKLIAEENLNSTFSEAIQSKMLAGLKETTASSVVLDLNSTELIDAIGLKLILGLYQTCQQEKRQLSIEVTHPQVSKTLTLYKLDQMMKIQECQP